jgi:hypothetical protein
VALGEAGEGWRSRRRAAVEDLLDDATGLRWEEDMDDRQDDEILPRFWS